MASEVKALLSNTQYFTRDGRPTALFLEEWLRMKRTIEALDARVTALEP